MKSLHDCTLMRNQLMWKFYAAYPAYSSHYKVRLAANSPIIFNPKMRSFAGRAFLRTKHTAHMKIELNVRLLAGKSEEFDNTFAHEIAHLVAFAAFGHRGHGLPWKNVMKVFGYAPTRCHKMDTSHLQRKHPVVAKAFCACREWDIKQRSFARTKAGMYFCKKCKQTLRISEEMGLD